MTSNARLALPYFLAYFLYVGVAALPLDRVPSYALRIALSGAALAWGFRSYRGILGPRSPLLSIAAGVAAGIAGTALWILLLGPLALHGEPWEGNAFVLRLLAATLLVPVFEEMALRGFLLRLVVQWQQAKGRDRFGEAWERMSIHDLPAGAYTAAAIAVSTAAFAAGHTLREVPAAIAYGLLMCGLWVWRRDLLTCIAAHAVTNLTLALYVRHTGEWGLW